MALLELKKIGKKFLQGEEEFWALKDIDLQIKEKEFVALVGPSGSGKTTLLNLVGALDRPSCGELLIDGRSIFSMNDHALSEFRLRQLGFVFQAYNLVPVLSALENVELVMILQGVAKLTCREKAEYFLEKVGLSDMMHRKPSALSGGQQQRVAVARALVSDPRLVLADEPTANLDSANAIALLDIMYELSVNQGTTFIFSTHDVRIMDKAKRILTLEDGQIVEDKRH